MSDKENESATKPGTVSSAIAILRLLAGTEYPVGVNAIARELGLAPSSCFKILKTLLAEDFVELDERTKAYSLGSGAISIAQRALDPGNAFASIRSKLEEVAHNYSIAIGLWRVVPHRRIVLVGCAEGSNQMRIHMPVGQRIPWLLGAVGRTIAAQLNLSDAELKREFETLRWQSPLTFDEYLTQVREAKKLGYGVDAGTFAPGVLTVGVPVIDTHGAVRYGLSGIMFNGQHDPATTRKIGKEMIELGQWTALRLTGGPVRSA